MMSIATKLRRIAGDPRDAGVVLNSLEDRALHGLLQPGPTGTYVDCG